MLSTVADQTFENMTLFVDGIRYERCHFVKTQFVYAAEKEADFIGCTFEDCSWTFDGAAERMIGFLSTLQERVIPDGPRIVHGVFHSIQNQKAATLRNIALGEPQPVDDQVITRQISIKTTSAS